MSGGYTCPHCRKPIYDDEALRCLYCGDSLNRGFGFMGKIKYPTPKIIIVLLVLFVVFAFLILISR